MQSAEFPVSDGTEGPYGVALGGRPGEVWTTLVHAGVVARRAADGKIERFGLDAPGSRPSVIVPGERRG